MDETNKYRPAGQPKFMPNGPFIFRPQPGMLPLTRPRSPLLQEHGAEDARTRSSTQAGYGPQGYDTAARRDLDAFPPPPPQAAFTSQDRPRFPVGHFNPTGKIAPPPRSVRPTPHYPANQYGMITPNYGYDPSPLLFEPARGITRCSDSIPIPQQRSLAQQDVGFQPSDHRGRRGGLDHGQGDRHTFRGCERPEVQLPMPQRTDTRIVDDTSDVTVRPHTRGDPTHPRALATFSLSASATPSVPASPLPTPTDSASILRDTTTSESAKSSLAVTFRDGRKPPAPFDPSRRSQYASTPFKTVRRPDTSKSVFPGSMSSEISTGGKPYAMLGAGNPATRKDRINATWPSQRSVQPGGSQSYKERMDRGDISRDGINRMYGTELAQMRAEGAGSAADAAVGVLASDEMRDEAAGAAASEHSQSAARKS